MLLYQNLTGTVVRLEAWRSDSPSEEEQREVFYDLDLEVYKGDSYNYQGPVLDWRLANKILTLIGEEELPNKIEPELEGSTESVHSYETARGHLLFLAKKSDDPQ